MRTLLVAALLAGALLAGCADDTTAAITDDALQGVQDLGIESTSTTGIIRGVVLDEAIRPLADSTVTLKGLNKQTTSNEVGAFGFEGLEPGTYFLEASKVGYFSVQQSAEVKAGDNEPPIVRVQLAINPGSAPFAIPKKWDGFIECSTRAGTGPANQGSVGLNACNGVGNQDVNFPLVVEAMPTLLQGETVWEDTQTLGSGLSFVVGPYSCTDIKWDRADGPSTLVINLTQKELENQDAFDADGGLCYRVFSYTAEESLHLVGLVLSQRFESYFHMFYNFLPPDGWKFSVDGEPVPPT